MALTHSIDTTVMKRLGQPLVRAAVEPHATRGQLGRPTICDLEVGYSARNAAEWDQLMASLGVYTTAAHLVRALQVQRVLAERSSRRGRKIPDLLVAAAGESLNLTVLHYDSDFG